MFEGMEDYSLDGNKKPNYGCFFVVIVGLILLIIGGIIGYFL